MAGYNGRNTIVFNGNLLEANSVRQGVNFVTTISAQDWSFVFSNVGTSGQQTTSFGPYAPPTTYRQIITDMINLGFQGKVRLGAIGGGYDNPIQRTVSFNGLAADLLYNLTGGSFYIDCGIAYVLDQSEMLPAPAVTVIDADTGLLNTPVLQNQVLTFDMLFEPGIIPGQMLALQSLTDPQRNGTYKVVEIQHSCTISDAVCGDAVTSVGMQNTKVYNGGTVIPLSINSGGPL
jgi:hypothetical protein